MELQNSILEKFIDYDMSELEDLSIKFMKISNELDKLENRFNIKTYSSSVNLNYPKLFRNNVLRKWTELYRLADELDYIFLGD